MLQLQSNAGGNAELTALLREAATRVVTVGRAYERLAYDGDNEKIDLGSYLQSVARDLEITASPCSILFKTETGILLSSDRAILLALIVNELVTNCAKYAYPGGTGGKIWVDVARGGHRPSSSRCATKVLECRRTSNSAPANGWGRG